MNIARITPIVGSLYALMRQMLGLNVATPLGAQELSCTVAPDRRLVVLGHEPIAGFARTHGTVADEAAMLALHTLDSTTLLAEPTFVAPGDSCLRADDPDWRWHCIAGHGTALAEWERRPLSSGQSGTAWGAITGDLAGQTDLVAALDARAATEHGHSLANLTQSGATNGQVPIWNGNQWVPQTPSSGGSSGYTIKTGLEVWLDCTADNAPVDLHAGRSCAWVGTPAGAAGKIGRAFSFDGSNQVNVLNYPTLQKKARSGWTCCAWINASAGDCYWAGANGDSALYARSWYAYINSGGATCQYAFSNDGWNWTHSVNAPCALNQWVFLALVCDPLNLSWIGYGHDGLAVRATLTSTPNENALALANNLYCGMAQGSAALLVDGFAYWRRPLRSEEIAHLHNDGAGRAYASL